VQKKVVIISAVTGALIVIALVVAILSAQQGNVRVISTDRHTKIDDIQYFPGKRFSYKYPRYQIPQPWMIRFQPLLRKFGLKARFTMALNGRGPLLLMIAHIKGGDMKYVDLVSEDGRSLSFPFPLVHFSAVDTNFFVLQCPLYDFNGREGEDCTLTNGVYRLRIEGETNDLAVIRVRYSRTNAAGQVEVSPISDFSEFYVAKLNQWGILIIFTGNQRRLNPNFGFVPLGF
jgi:hypothetical protein